MIEERITITYCGSNPQRHGSDLFGRLAKDDRFDVRPAMCYKLCNIVCSDGLYAFVSGKRVEGKTENSFLENIASSTGLDMSQYYKKQIYFPGLAQRYPRTRGELPYPHLEHFFLPV